MPAYLQMALKFYWFHEAADKTEEPMHALISEQALITCILIILRKIMPLIFIQCFFNLHNW